MKNASLSLLAICSLSLGGFACKEAQAKTKGIGDSFRPFIVKNCGTGERYCQVCAYGGKPTIMVVADIADKKVEADLVQVQAILDKNSEKGLTAFALFGKIEGGKFVAVKDDAAAAANLKATAERLKLTYPVTVVPSKYTDAEAKGYTAFVDAYDVNTSRRVMLADQRNKVLFADTITDATQKSQFEKLAEAVAKL